MNPRVFGAIIAGLILVVAAYTHTRAVSDESAVSGTLAVADRNAPPRMYIPTNDRDNDGVPDWQQALRTTEPLQLEPLASSTYEVPDTLTDRFAVDLFGKMIKSKQYGEFGDNPDELISQANEQLLVEASDTLYTLNDIIISNDNSIAAIRSYANRVAVIALENGIPRETPNEILILERAVQQNNPDVLQELEVIIQSYQGMLTAMLQTPVPSTLQKQHLDLINTYQAVLGGVQAFAIAFDDPLRALIRLQRYRDDATGLYYAYTGVFKAAYEAGARFEPGVDATLQVVTFEDTDT